MPFGEVLSGFTMGFRDFLDYGIFKCARRNYFAGVQLDSAILTMQLDIVSVEGVSIIIATCLYDCQYHVKQ